MGSARHRKIEWKLESVVVFPSVQVAKTPVTMTYLEIEHHGVSRCNVDAVPPISNVPAESHLTSAWANLVSVSATSGVVV